MTKIIDYFNDCCTCKYFNEFAGNYSCERFPNGIPDELAKNWVDMHCERYVKQDTSEEAYEERRIKWLKEHPEELED